MRLSRLPGSYTVAKYEAVPPHPSGSAFSSLSVTPQEISLVCNTASLPDGAGKTESGWAALMIEGPLDFSLVGILSELTGLLAKAHISVFAISTFDTDVLMVKETSWDDTIACLKEAGHDVA